MCRVWRAACLGKDAKLRAASRYGGCASVPSILCWLTWSKGAATPWHWDHASWNEWHTCMPVGLRFTQLWTVQLCTSKNLIMTPYKVSWIITVVDGSKGMVCHKILPSEPSIVLRLLATNLNCQPAIYLLTTQFVATTNCVWHASYN